ncbi:hypothetical protein BKA81DRAFT_20406 [Phyllosticta paracitricarpa]
MDTIAFASIQAVESFQFCLLTLRLEEACEADGLSLVYYTASDESALLSTRKGALTHYSQTLPLFFDPEHHRTILFLRRHWHMLFRQKRCRPFSKSPIISMLTRVHFVLIDATRASPFRLFKSAFLSDCGPDGRLPALATFPSQTWPERQSWALLNHSSILQYHKETMASNFFFFFLSDVSPSKCICTESIR